MRHDSNEIETVLLVAVFSWAPAAEVAGLVNRSKVFISLDSNDNFLTGILKLW
jgi:hypothetical protein